MEEKYPCRTSCVLSDNWFYTSAEVAKSIQIIILVNKILKNYVTLEGAVSRGVLYSQQLSFSRYQVSVYASFE